jgi:hypothetical protein
MRALRTPIGKKMARPLPSLSRVAFGYAFRRKKIFKTTSRYKFLYL